MREIKFRAWDEGNEVMHNNFQYISSGDEGNDWIIFISDKFTLENHDTNPFRNPSPYFSHQLKRMQYAGLKDKNGVDIYEGDIVKIGLNRWNITKIKEVIFTNGRFGTVDVFDNLNNCEVIGNIYENGDLLI